MIPETEDYLIKRLTEWEGNVENRGVKVNMNKTTVMISGEPQKVMRRLQDGHVMSVVEVSIVIQ